MKPFGIVILLLFFISGCGQSDKHTYQGYVEAENIYLASPFSGTLNKMLVQRGEHVKKGQLLFKLDSNPQDLALEEAHALMQQQKELFEDARLPKRKPEIDSAQWAVTQVEAQIRLALLRVKRYEMLVQKHAIDKDTLDSAKEHYEELLAVLGQRKDDLIMTQLGARAQQIKALEHSVAAGVLKGAQIKWQLSQKSLYAPVDGIVFDTYFRVGELVSAERPVAAILDPKNVRIEFFVPVERMSTLKVGQNVTYACDGCNKINKAVIWYVSPEAEYIPPLVYSRDNNDKLVFRIKATPEHLMSLKPGQPVVITGFSNES